MPDFPIKTVIVMEDRAQIERHGRLVVHGRTVLIVDEVSPLAVDRSIKVTALGGTVIDAKFERRWKEQPAGGLPADASELRRNLRALEDGQVLGLDEDRRIEARGEILAAARADLLRSMAERTGHSDCDIPLWKTQLATISKRQAEWDEESHRRRQALALLEQRITDAKRALALAERPPQRFECAVRVTIEAQGPVELNLSYLVPCAVWRPTYRATAKAESLRVEAEAMVWQQTGEDWADVELMFSTARPTLGTTPPTLVEDRLLTRPKQQQEQQRVQVQVREESIDSLGKADGEPPEVAGLDDGGETRLLHAQGPCTIRSDGRPHRVSLFEFESPVQYERLCPAELSRTPFLFGRFSNSSQKALLAGPVDIVRDSGLVGRTQLKFAAPGELVKMSLGREDGVFVVRNVGEDHEEARLTGRRTTTHTAKLHLSNTRATECQLVLEERIPVSELKDVEVRIINQNCRPVPSEVTPEGIVRIGVTLPAHGTETAVFCWEMSVAAKVSGV